MATENRQDVARELGRRFGPLSKQALAHLADLLAPIKVTKGKYVLRAGEICKDLYYVHRGLLHVYSKIGGQAITTQLVGEGEVTMSAESLFGHSTSQQTFRALEPTMVYAIPYSDFRETARTSYEYCSFMFSVLQQSLLADRRRETVLRVPKARDRYLGLLASAPDVVRRAPQHVVASYLGITPETLSRVRTALGGETGEQ